MLIITYAVFLVLAVIKFDVILDLVKQVLSSCRPLFLGFAIAFVLNRPCAFFCRHYERNLGVEVPQAGPPTGGAYFLCGYDRDHRGSVLLCAAPGGGQHPAVCRQHQRLYGQSPDYYQQDCRLFGPVLPGPQLAEQLSAQLLGGGAHQRDHGSLPGDGGTSSHSVHVVTWCWPSCFPSICWPAGRSCWDQGRRLLRAYLPAKHVSWVSDVIRLTAETLLILSPVRPLKPAFWVVCALWVPSSSRLTMPPSLE